MNKIGNIIGDEAKDRNENYQIALSSSTVAALREYKSQSVQNPYDLVICTSKGTPMSPANLRREWQRLIRLRQVPQIRFHDLRHTHASLMLKQGEHVKVVSERLGHSKIQMTLDTYSHVMPNMQAEAANRFDALLANAN
ncbi:tyrosine-type recombinase/integrase [Aneurinibacillus tyrosinisolvens]|uniref:tyrosine-type recombinase/integrase n=1 Tax=Aneurinibacillus tyrosinisolvens TaxID=1443435 RepID=UPI0009E5D2C2|nr:site-specific integrase [Aneurinibacillus tyrosinisolvens]